MPVPKTNAALKAELLRRNSAGLFPSMECDDCLYRGPGGRRCPAGVCIPDSRYRKSMEGVRAYAVFYNGLKLPDGVTLNMIQDLQRAHDSLGRSGKRWSKRKFAKAVKEILG